MEEPFADTGSEDWKSHVDLQQSLNEHLGPEEEMEKAAQPERTVLYRHNAENSDAHNGRFHAKHLKPLSIYSRVVTSDKKTNLHHSTNFTSPFVNLKIGFVNLFSAKRKQDDSCLDDSYDTPAKKPYSPKLLSPDLGCFLDCREDLVSPTATSKPELLDATVGIRSSWKESVKSQLHWDLEDGRSEESGGTEQRIAPHTVVSKNLNPVAFDCDVSDIFCPKPYSSESAGGRPDAVESRLSDADSDTAQNKPVSCNPAQRRGSERGEEEKPEEIYLNVKDKEEEYGARFSLSRQKYLKTGKRASQPGDADVPQATSSPLLRTGSTEMPGNELRSQTCSPTVHRSHLVPDGRAVESLYGDAEELWSIGAPVFESSVCQGVTEKPEVCIEEAEGSVVDLVDDGGEVSSQSTFLQVQVRSVVYVPNHQAARSKTAAEKEVEPAESIGDGRRQRTRDWEREKRLYVDSVTRHLNESSSAGDGAMTEMLNLMADVAHREYGAPGRRWQHPSDLTRSNYQRRFGNQTPRMSLHEWWSRNGPALKRFANMTNSFERSPVP